MDRWGLEKMGGGGDQPKNRAGEQVLWVKSGRCLSKTLLAQGDLLLRQGAYLQDLKSRVFPPPPLI